MSAVVASFSMGGIATSSSIRTRSRAELAAELIAELAEGRPAGTRLGSRRELRERCGVSVGTFQEALRVLQSRGIVVLRPGPGGGVFTAEQSALERLSGEVIALGDARPDPAEIMRIVRALDPLILEDAARSRKTSAELRDRVTALAAARDAGRIGLFLHASLEVYSTIVSRARNPLLRAFTGILLNARMVAIVGVDGPIDRGDAVLVDEHLAAVTEIADALIAGDVETALLCYSRSDPVALFDRILRRRTGDPR